MASGVSVWASTSMICVSHVGRSRWLVAKIDEDREERREGYGPRDHSAPIELARTRNRSNGDTHCGDSKIRATQVDHDAKTEPLLTGVGDDHRQSDERSVAPTSNQQQSAGALPRPAQRTAERNDHGGGEDHVEPRRCCGEPPVVVDGQVVHAAERRGRERDVDHPATEHAARVVR
jgi:hypothetical protein